MTQIALPASKMPTRRSNLKNWIGVTPFFLFALLFIFLPSVRLFVGSFTNADGRFTLENVIELFTQQYILDSYSLSIRISAVTALGGGIFGFLLAYAVTVGGLPKPMRSALITFSGVASNFAGVPLAFAFFAPLGRTGFFSPFLKEG